MRYKMNEKIRYFYQLLNASGEPRWKWLWLRSSEIQ